MLSILIAVIIGASIAIAMIVDQQSVAWSIVSGIANVFPIFFILKCFLPLQISIVYLGLNSS